MSVANRETSPAPAMCPEQLEALLEHLGGPFTFSPPHVTRYRPFGIAEGHGDALEGAYLTALPAKALGYRLYGEPSVRDWVDELARLPEGERRARAREMARGAPRGTGRVLIAKMLLHAAENGAVSLARAGDFGAFLSARRQEIDPQRAAKRGLHHDRLRSLAVTADRIVRALAAYPLGIEPAENPGAARRAASRLLHQAEAHLDSGRLEL